MQKLEFYPAGGVGHCKLCMTGTTPLVDTERDYDEFYAGRLYICSNCGNEIARLLGWQDEAHYNDKADEVAGLEDRLDAITLLMNDAEDENARLRSLLKDQLTETPEIVSPVKRHPGRPRKVQG